MAKWRQRNHDQFKSIKGAQTSAVRPGLAQPGLAQREASQVGAG